MGESQREVGSLEQPRKIGPLWKRWLVLLIVVEVFLLFEFAITNGWLESLTEDAVGLSWWAVLWGIQFPVHSWMAPALLLERRYGTLKHETFWLKALRVGAMVAGLMLITIVLEDFFAVGFAGLVDLNGGVNGSLMGVPYLCPKTAQWIEPAIRWGYIQIINFKIPVAYLVFVGSGIFLISISFFRATNLALISEALSKRKS